MIAAASPDLVQIAREHNARARFHAEGARAYLFTLVDQRACFTTSVKLRQAWMHGRRGAPCMRTLALVVDARPRRLPAVPFCSASSRWLHSKSAATSTSAHCTSVPGEREANHTSFPERHARGGAPGCFSLTHEPALSSAGSTTSWQLGAAGSGTADTMLRYFKPVATADGSASSADTDSSVGSKRKRNDGACSAADAPGAPPPAAAAAATAAAGTGEPGPTKKIAAATAAATANGGAGLVSPSAAEAALERAPAAASAASEVAAAASAAGTSVDEASAALAALDINVHSSWAPVVLAEARKPYFKKLQAFLNDKRAKTTVYPPQEHVFSALRLTPLDTVRVVILGQDPYHQPGQAHGLAFSVQRGVAQPPSLVNILKEVEADLGFPRPKHGNLEYWARQGVLLLNAVLTVERGAANSHAKQGWEEFTTAIIRCVPS